MHDLPRPFQEGFRSEGSDVFCLYLVDAGVRSPAERDASLFDELRDQRMDGQRVGTVT